MKKRLATIPTVFAFVACLAVAGCGDLGTAPSLDGPGPPLLDVVGDPMEDRDRDLLRCVRVLDENTGRVLVIDNHLPNEDDRKLCPVGFTRKGF